MLAARNYREIRDKIDSGRIVIDPLRLDRNFTEQEAQAVRRTMHLNVNSRFAPGHAGNNPHSMLASLRRQLERGVVQQIGEFVSVGSTQSRELTYTARSHMLCPTVIDSDSVHDTRFIPERWTPLTND